MIDFSPLWKTLEQKNFTTYRLLKEYNFSKGTLDSLKHNRNVTLHTIESLCRILEVPIEKSSKSHLKILKTLKNSLYLRYFTQIKAIDFIKKYLECHQILFADPHLSECNLTSFHHGIFHTHTYQNIRFR